MNLVLFNKKLIYKIVFSFILFSLAILLIIFFKPKLFFNNFNTIITSYMYENYDVTCSIENIEGNFLSGFDINNLKCDYDKQIILQSKHIFIKLSIMNLILSKIKITDFILNEIFVNADLSLK